MGKKYVVENKVAATIFNLIIVLICLASILAYFVAPLWKVDVKYTMTAETFKSMIGTGADGSGSSDGSGGADTADGSDEGNALMQEIEKELEKNPIQAEFGLTLKTRTFLSSFSGNGEKLVADLIDYNVDSLVKQLSGTVKSVSAVMVKSAAKFSLKEILKDPETGAEYEWKNEETINTELDKLTDALLSDDATVSSVLNATVEAAENIYESETGNTISEEDKAKVREEMEKILNEVADETGNIDVDQLIADMLAQAMNGSEGSGNGGGEIAEKKEEAGAKYAFAAFTVSAESESGGSESGSESGAESGETADAMQQLKNTLTNTINEQIGDKMSTLVLVMKIVGGVIIFTLFTWAYIVLKIICKSASANPVVKLKLPIWLGWLPFTVLYILPASVMKLAAKAGAASSAMSGLSVSFFTCGIVSAIAALALIILWIPYHNLKSRA